MSDPNQAGQAPNSERVTGKISVVSEVKVYNDTLRITMADMTFQDGVLVRVDYRNVSDQRVGSR